MEFLLSLSSVVSYEIVVMLAIWWMLLVSIRGRLWRLYFEEGGLLHRFKYPYYNSTTHFKFKLFNIMVGLLTLLLIISKSIGFHNDTKVRQFEDVKKEIVAVQTVKKKLNQSTFEYCLNAARGSKDANLSVEVIKACTEAATIEVNLNDPGLIVLNDELKYSQYAQI